MGILNGDDYQVVYSDTPGIIEPRYKLHEKMRSIDFLYKDAHNALSLTDEILTFGNAPYQRLKLSLCSELRNIPVTIIQEAKGPYITAHYTAPVMVIDDKHLEDEVPEWCEFILIDRTQQEPTLRHDRYISIHSLSELARLANH